MKELFDTIRLGNLELKNRCLRAATWEGIADASGHINDEVMALYRDLARGGASAIITGYAFVLKDEQPNPKMFGAYDDSFVDSYKPLTDMVHDNGSKIFLQLVYGGSFTWFDTESREIWGPSAVTNKISGVTPKEMTPLDIQTLIEAFGDAARRAMESGFDGVEMHAGHGYLLNQFLSPFFNQREDVFGGTSEKRARILFDIFENIRKKTTPDFPILIKLNCSDFMGTKGFTFEECLALCKKLDAMGIAGIEISGGPVFRAPKTEKETTYEVTLPAQDSYFSEYARVIAEAVSAPVILVGGNRSVDTMEQLLADTDIACFSFSRPLLCEPDLINKWQADKTVKPRCTSCGQCFTLDGNSCIQNREKAA
ncbi:NADH:flavin oxidoreductase [Desulfoluna spongiiphila]|uniref:2,4-dienoyl-CoA reductase n=1 Tax=Desulfoluna spongiiphila TaxID=419481 RepID=A0A1G5DXT7_9BACT|nr:NADH:flavin oxidoreductase [Desulfoluna spongiiphila]SCY19566.1 2,4-dienoyl-CoA reductase [Desulfoluna spongiiphila]